MVIKYSVGLGDIDGFGKGGKREGSVQDNYQVSDTLSMSMEVGLY